MNKLLPFLTIGVVLLALVRPIEVYSAQSDMTTLGEQFVDLLVKEDFAEAVARYDETMRTALPEPKLREAWRLVEGQAGHFKKRLHTRTQALGGYDVALVTCEFEKAKLDTKVVFNSHGEVAGLFFLPSTYEAATQGPPPYARTNAFREKDFTVGAGEWSLPGTLTLPLANGTSPVPAIVLVHGSGPNDRDETVGGSKPFRDLAWGLATKGVAVLRYDKRTRVHADRFISSGTITIREETIDDAVSAAKQLRETEGIDPHRVFVLGHSLGGMLAPRIGKADPQIAGLVIMAGATRPLEDMIVEQNRYILSLKGKLSAEDEEKLRDLEAKAAKIKKLTASSSDSIFGAPAGYWLDLRGVKPVAEARPLKLPLLILQGGRDYQVTQLDFGAWKNGLGASSNTTFKLYPKLNHLFIAGEGKSSPEEYEKGGDVSEEVVADIAEWILKKH